MTNLWITPVELGTPYSTSSYADDACQLASNILWAMSGRRYAGAVTVTERYFTAIDAFRYQGSSAKQFFPHMIGGTVFNLPAEDWNDSAYQSDGSSSLSRIRLRGRPVQKVHLVRSGYDGTIIPQDSYYIADHSTLIAYKGIPWAPGNLEVTYTYGQPPPSSGRQAAMVLAIEFIKLWEGDPCALPDRVTSITRQGVSYTILDNQDFLENFRTGLYPVDLFLRTANPAKALAPSKVFSPDIPRARRISPTRARVLPKNVTYDAVLQRSNNWSVSQIHTCVGSLAALANYNNPGFTLELVGYSYAGTVARTFGSESAYFTTIDGVSYINLAFDYKSTYQAIGFADPGTWALFARDVDTGARIELLEGNLQILKVTALDINPISAQKEFGAPVTLGVRQGYEFSKVIKWNKDGAPVNLTGYTADMDIKTSADAETAIISLTTENGRIAFNEAAGEIILSISAEDTTDIPAGEYVFTLTLTSPGGVLTRLMTGYFVVPPEVTSV